MNKFLKEEKIIDNKIRKLIAIRNFKIICLKIVIIILILYIFFEYIFGFFRMKDNSMYPFISEGELLLYYKINEEYAAGDVVVFILNDKKYALRIVATPGQTVDISYNGELLIDGYPEQNQSFFETTIPENSKINYPYLVQPGYYFVVGDYRVEAEDSRIFGAISSDKIEGSVISLLKTRNI